MKTQNPVLVSVAINIAMLFVVTLGLVLRIHELENKVRDLEADRKTVAAIVQNLIHLRN